MEGKGDRRCRSENNEWERAGYRGAAASSFLANLGISSSAAKSAPSSPSPLDIKCDPAVFETPVAVMNLPTARERRESSRALFSALGFVNISFPPVLVWSTYDEAGEGFVNGSLGGDIFQRLKWRGDNSEREGLLRYAANALSQLQRIESAAAGVCSCALVRASARLGVSDYACKAEENRPSGWAGASILAGHRYAPAD